MSLLIEPVSAAPMAQWVRAFAPQAKGWDLGFLAATDLSRQNR